MANGEVNKRRRLLGLLVICLLVAGAQSVSDKESATEQADSEVQKEKPEETEEDKPITHTLEQLTEQALFQMMSQKKRMVVYFTRDQP